MGIFSDSRKQMVDSMKLPFDNDGGVHVLVMNVYGSTGVQSTSGVDEKASHVVNAMITKLDSMWFTLLDVDVYPDPSKKGVTGAPCYNAVFKVK